MILVRILVVQKNQGSQQKRAKKTSKEQWVSTRFFFCKWRLDATNNNVTYRLVALFGSYGSGIFFYRSMNVSCSKNKCILDITNHSHAKKSWSIAYQLQLNPCYPTWPHGTPWTQLWCPSSTSDVELQTLGVQHHHTVLNLGVEQTRKDRWSKLGTPTCPKLLFLQ